MRLVQDPAVSAYCLAKLASLLFGLGLLDLYAEAAEHVAQLVGEEAHLRLKLGWVQVAVGGGPVAGAE